jgi:hypothetical protein
VPVRAAAFSVAGARAEHSVVVLPIGLGKDPHGSVSALVSLLIAKEQWGASLALPPFWDRCGLSAAIDINGHLSQKRESRVTYEATQQTICIEADHCRGKA